MAANALLSSHTVADAVRPAAPRVPFNLLARLNRIVDRLFGFDLQEEEIRALSASADDTSHRKASASSVR
jgi:hypothetical protein